MTLVAREMDILEATIIVDYFHQSTPEHLEMLGVDPTRLPNQREWIARLRGEFQMPIERRSNLYVTWLLDDHPVGFSNCNKIIFGEHAYMHLQIVNSEHRRQGIGFECVKQSIELYFTSLKLKELFCEPNAFNVGPNRTLQKAGFKYLKTHMTVPGPFNYHQAVNRWVIAR